MSWKEKQATAAADAWVKDHRHILTGQSQCLKNAFEAGAAWHSQQMAQELKTNEASPEKWGLKMGDDLWHKLMEQQKLADERMHRQLIAGIFDVEEESTDYDYTPLNECKRCGNSVSFEIYNNGLVHRLFCRDCMNVFTSPATEHSDVGVNLLDKKPPHKCHCDINTVLHYGCKCGGV